MTVTNGTRLGPYEVLAPIGSGGMGDVYKGRDTRLDRSVAIKVLPAALTHDAQFRLRLDREARTISQLNHPHICTLYDVGHENGTDYLVMELIEGESLADRLAKGPLPLEQVLRYGVQIADALHKAHRHGIVHRDLKPGNIMLTKSGAKLLDFGLAKMSDSSSITRDSSLTEHKPITEQGTVVGTFQYMAPEQLEGSEADARTDIFALGAVLYEMATGRRAFEGKTRTSLIAAIVSSDPPPLSQVQPLTPPALEHVIRKCLAKDPEDRWQSAHDIASELRWVGEAGSQAGVAAPLIARRRSRERLIWVLALLAAVAATAGVMTRLRPSQDPLSYRFLLPQRDSGYSRALAPVISPDGKQVVFMATSADGKPAAHVRRLDDFSVTVIPTVPWRSGDAFWSPDSKAFASFADGKLWRTSAGGGASQVIADVPSFYDGAWSETGSILVGQTEGGLLQIPREGGPAVEITKPDQARFERGHHAPVFLPGGTDFLFIAFTRNPDRQQALHTLYAGRLGSSEIRRIGEVPSKVAYSRGYLFFVRGGSLVAAPFDAETLAFTGDGVLIADDVNYFQPTGRADFSVSDDGTLTWAPNDRAERLLVVDRAGKVAREVGEVDAFRWDASLSADGSSVVVAREDRVVGTFDLWMYGLHRPTATRLTFEPAEERTPVLSADGTTLYYTTDRKGVPDIAVKNLDGGDDRSVLELPGEQATRDISRDGRYLLCDETRDRKTGRDIFVYSVHEKKATVLVQTPVRETRAKFSPDAKWIAYESDASGRSEIYAKPFPGPGAARQVSIAGGHRAHWSRDGRSIYYLTSDWGGRTIMQADFRPDGETSEPRVLFTLADDIAWFEELPDGRFVVMAVNEAAASVPARVIVRWPDTVSAR